MDEPLKRRLVGATVILSLVVIFIPMLVEDEPITREEVGESKIPEEPESDLVQREFQTEELVPLGGDKGKGSSAGNRAAGNGSGGESAASPPAGETANAVAQAGQQAQPPGGGASSAPRVAPEVARNPPAANDDVPAVGVDVAPLEDPEPEPAVSEAAAQDASLEDLRRGDLKAWVVQVASFTNPKFASNLVDELREKGFAAFMEDVHSNGRIWYRVVVGPEVDKQRTRDLQDAIVKATDDERLRGAIKSYP